MADAAQDTATAETPAEAEKPAKIVKQPHRCLCQSFEVGNFDPAKEGTEDEEIFSTGCTQTTMSTFAQGHDARLVSFLVDGHFDGYTLRQVVNGVSQTFATPADAAAQGSDALRLKAEKATANRQEKVTATEAKKAERERVKAEKDQAKADAKAAREKEKENAKAAKANEPKSTGAAVAAGSREGEPITGPEGTTRIKVGRWEFDAVIGENGAASYTDGKGEAQLVERDGYRVLTPAV